MTKGIQSIVLGFRLLQAIVEARGPLSLKEVAALGDMSPSKARGYLISFIQTGLVAQNPATGLYALGPYALRLATRALQRMELSAVATDVMQSLHHRTDALVLLCAWGSSGILVVSRSESGDPQPLLYQIGATASLANTATGHVFLAFGPQADTWGALNAELAGTGLSNTQRKRRLEAVENQVRKVRHERFAEADPIYYAPGATLTGYAAVAVPILDGAQRLRYALTVVYQTDRPASRKEHIIRLTREAANHLSHLAGADLDAEGVPHSRTP